MSRILTCLPSHLDKTSFMDDFSLLVCIGDVIHSRQNSPFICLCSSYTPLGEVSVFSFDNHCTQKGWRVLITLLINVVQSRTSKVDRKTFLIAPDDRIIMFGWV